MSKSKEQELWEACTSGNLDLVKHLANDPAVNVNWIGQDKRDAPLHRACRFGHLSIVGFLLELQKVDVNAGNAGKATPFFIACQEGHREVVLLLLADMRINGNKPTNKGRTPFFMACQKSQREVVSLLLADMRIDINKPMNDNCTPLRTASQLGHLPVAQLILASGREVDTKTKSIAGTAAWNHKVIATLIDSDEHNPQQVRTQLRKELGFAGCAPLCPLSFQLTAV